jgi:dienelactone hydrolase
MHAFGDAIVLRAVIQLTITYKDFFIMRTQSFASWLAKTAVAASFVFAVWSAPASAICPTGPYTVKSVAKTYRDAARGNRSVGATVYYPTASSSSTAIIAGCSFPVISFGHGFTIGNNAYGFLSARLVPSGYVVVLPSTEGGLSPNHTNFGKDLAFVLNAVRSDAAFAGALGTRTAIGGHSMGGGAAFLGATNNPGLTALFAFAPAETNPKASTAALGVSVPTMVLTGTKDCVVPYATNAGLMLANLATPDASTYDARIRGGKHCQFSSGSFTCSIGESSSSCSDGSGDAAITAAQQQTLTMDTLKPFLDLVLKGQ